MFDIVHENDRWMVRDKDLIAMAKLGIEGVEHILKLDDGTRMGWYIELRNRGFSPEEAGIRVRRDFPTYYAVPEGRSFEKMQSDDDARLPFAMKKRLSPLTLLKVKNNLTGAHSSFNACVRDLLRKGKI